MHDDGPDPGGQGFPPDFHDAGHLRLKAALLAVWALASFGVVYFARDLQSLMPDWPLAYWLAAQGSVLMFLVVLIVYCLAMSHLERRGARSGTAPSHGAQQPPPHD
ncbi:DUF4212 domain-containing protein [Comamonas composti]|uniref:DUF4212 domain-containing protein n=1 Tax=Comamonas composti TaxID=408558 RepID=UPI0004298425